MTDRTVYAFCGVFAGCMLGLIAVLPMNVDPLVALALGALAFVLAAAFARWMDVLEQRRRRRRAFGPRLSSEWRGRWR